MFKPTILLFVPNHLISSLFLFLSFFCLILDWEFMIAFLSPFIKPTLCFLFCGLFGFWTIYFLSVLPSDGISPPSILCEKLSAASALSPPGFYDTLVLQFTIHIITAVRCYYFPMRSHLSFKEFKSEGTFTHMCSFQHSSFCRFRFLLAVTLLRPDEIPFIFPRAQVWFFEFFLSQKSWFHLHCEGYYPWI